MDEWINMEIKKTGKLCRTINTIIAKLMDTLVSITREYYSHVVFGQTQYLAVGSKKGKNTNYKQAG